MSLIAKRHPEWSDDLRMDSETRQYLLQLENKLERVESLCRDTVSDKTAEIGMKRFARTILGVIQ